MMNSEPKIRFITSEHLKRYEKFHSQLEKRAISVKEKIFLEFFGKNYKKYLDFQLKINPTFGSWISNFNINLSDYNEMIQSFLYPIIIGKVQNSIEVLTNFVNTFKNLLNENNVLRKMSNKPDFHYIMSKMVTDFYKIEIYFWGCHYDMEESGNIKNLQIVNNKIYDLKEVLDSFFTVAKNGEWYTDEGILQAGSISEEEYTKRYAEKFIKYRTMLIENSLYAGKDPTTENLPDALIVGINKRPDITKISAETSQNIWKELQIQPTVLESLNSIDFYILGLEPIAIDSMLVLNELFR